MLILHDPQTLDHKTVEILGAKLIPAIECPERIISILDSLRLSSHEVQQHRASTSQEEQTHNGLTQVLNASHDVEYLRHLQTAHADWVKAGLISEADSILPECFPFQSRTGFPSRPPKDIFARVGYYAFDMSTGIMSQTATSVLASAELAYRGACLLTAWSTSRQVEQDQQTPPSKDIFALCRPPGHHCDTRHAGGYCYINNAVVAVETFLSRCPGRKVAILDIDFHHGNGTQEYFYDRGDVIYVSLHGEDEFPYYTGARAETGVGEGLGFNVNLPLPSKSSLAEYLKALEVGLQRMRSFQPDFLVLSLGFDTFSLDPLGGFDIGTADYGTIARCIRSRLKDMPALILLEGGYVLESLGDNVLSFLSGWEGPG